MERRIRGRNGREYLERGLGAVREDIDDVASLARRHDELEEGVAHLEEAVASADAEIESLRDTQEMEFASVHSEVEVLRSDLAELRSIMTSIRGVFAREDFHDGAGPGLDA